AGAGFIRFGFMGAAHTGAELGIEDDLLRVQQAGTVAQREAALAVVGGKVVTLVTRVGGELAVLAQLQAAGGTGTVTVGGGLAEKVDAAVVLGAFVFGAAAQSEQVHRVDPVAFGITQAQLAVEGFRGAVAA